MEIRLLKSGYKNNEQFYLDFLEDKIIGNEDYFSDDYVTVSQIPDFPFYMGRGSAKERNEDFLTAFQIIAKYYIQTERDLHLDEVFWHSLLVTKKRDYILTNYPNVKESHSNFKNIVTKNLDWQNYIYKCVLAAEYIEDMGETAEQKNRLYSLVLDNLDVFNYIIKYPIFRNAEFTVKILTIIDELDISKIMKAYIPNRPDLGEDPRYGRQVIYELNKNYPIVMAPMMEKDELKVEVLKALSYYYDISSIQDQFVTAN